VNNLTELAAKFNLGVKTVIVQTVDVSDVPLPPRLLGTLTPAVQQIMMAQRIRTVDQPAEIWSTDRGIGILGLNLLQIYDLGLIKPQLFDQFVTGNTNVDSVGLVPPSLNFNESQVYDALNLRTAWTGQYNVNSIEDILSRPTLQYILQQDSYILSYNSLISNNIINGTEDIEVMAMTVGLTSIYGFAAVVQFLGNQL
jgi:hypothetical protein